MRELTAAIIGLGNIGMHYDFSAFSTNEVLGRSHVGACLQSEQIQLQHLVDVVEPKFYLRPGHAKIFSRWDEFQAEQCSYDLLILATPVNTHLPIIEILSMKHEFKYAIIEKPVGGNASESRKISEILRSKGVLWLPNYMRSFSEGAEVAAQYLRTHPSKLKEARIRGYGSLRNVFSHMIHLAMRVSGPQFFVAGKMESPLSFELGSALRVSLDGVGFPEVRNCSLELFFSDYSFHFFENGFSSSIIEARTGELVAHTEFSEHSAIQSYTLRRQLKIFEDASAIVPNGAEKVHGFIDGLESKTIGN